MWYPEEEIVEDYVMNETTTYDTKRRKLTLFIVTAIEKHAAESIAERQTNIRQFLKEADRAPCNHLEQ